MKMLHVSINIVLYYLLMGFLSLDLIEEEGIRRNHFTIGRTILLKIFTL